MIAERTFFIVSYSLIFNKLNLNQTEEAVYLIKYLVYFCVNHYL